ncbi:MAG: class I SAM-dependent methyltransferase [candidate division WOR-3 bacterium]
MASRIIDNFINPIVGLKIHRLDITSDLEELNEIRTHARNRTTINDHLETLFAESICSNPKLIIELGVETGQSTFVFERVARLCKARFISVDINDCSNACSWADWIFVQRDDIEFAKEFESFCKNRNIEPKIDILFIDTSHLYEHTLQEIESYFPYLSNKAKVFFHDTNMKNIFRRKDGSMGVGWDNRRGVIRALEVYFGKSFDEKHDFIDCRKGWLIKHYHHCNGLTILERMVF